MVAVIGKAMFWFLTSCAVVGVTATLLHGPPKSEATPIIQQAPSKPHCDYVQFAQKADTTFWQADCVGGALPWDSSYAKWRADP